MLLQQQLGDMVGLVSADNWMIAFDGDYQSSLTFLPGGL